jgi:hypothetical protein
MFQNKFCPEHITAALIQINGYLSYEESANIAW